MRPFVFAASCAVLVASHSALAQPAYHLVKSVPLGAPDEWDYLNFDAAHGRVLAAHGNHVAVIDGKTGAVIGRLSPIAGAHGAVVTTGNKVFADNGDPGTATMFDGQTYAALKTVPAGQDADAVAYDPATDRVIVMDGDGQAATLLDGASGDTAATVKLDGSPESAVSDGSGTVFANIASTGELARIDAKAGKVTAYYKLPDCVSPHGLAIDTQAKLVFPTCLNGKMLVVDAATGKVRQTLPIGHGTDEAAFDPSHGRAFSSNGDGTLSVMQVEKDGSVHALAPVKTAPGARTMTVDPATGRVFLITADVSGTRPPGHGGLVPHYTFKPGTAKLLIFDPGA